jgi:hypothetical protein
MRKVHYMQVASLSGRFLGRIMAVGFMLAAAGCQSGDTVGLLKLGGDSEPKEKVALNELRAFCPRVQLRDGEAVTESYTRDGKDKDGNVDRTKLIHQASIGDVTRSCSYGPGTMTVNVAVAGRVVPGPAATNASVSLPIRIVAMRGEEVLYSQVHQYPVMISPTAGAAQFVFNDPNVTFPTPPDSKVIVYAGFDQGPEKKSKPKPN